MVTITPKYQPISKTDNCRISPELIILFKQLPPPCNDYKCLPIILSYCSLNYSKLSDISHIATILAMYQHWFETNQDLIAKAMLVNSANAILRIRKFKEHFDWVAFTLNEEKNNAPYLFHEYAIHP